MFLKNWSNKIGLGVIFFAFVSLFIAGCESETKNSSDQQSMGNSAVNYLVAGENAPPHSSQTQQPLASAKVLSVTAAGSYIYIEAEDKAGKYWLATTNVSVKAGDQIQHAQGQLMKNFQSKTLNKTFPTILFLDRILVNGEAAARGTQPRADKSSGGIPTAPQPAVAVKAGSVKKAAGGYTVEEIFQKKDQLKNKEVKVSGVVVKFLSGIMGKNWIHLRDGSGQAGTDDLTVTTSQVAKAGDLILVNGELILDKDFGQGYFYPVIIEDAMITHQKK